MKNREPYLPSDNDSKVIVRKVKPEDLHQLLLIERMSFPTPWDGGTYMVEMVRPSAEFLVAEKQGRPIGYVCAWVVADEGHVLKIAVDREFRNRGVGKALMEALAERIRRRGAFEILLEVRHLNQVARDFYQALEFDEIGVRRGYYSDTGEDAVLMIKTLLEDE